MVQFFLAIIAIIGVVAWINQHPVSVPESTEVRELAASASAPAYFDEVGMVVIEDNGDEFGVPWIVYQGPNRPVATKQLIFESTSTCDAGARVVPCATPTRESGYPVTADQRIRVQGWVDGEKVKVERLTYL